MNFLNDAFDDDSIIGKTIQWGGKALDGVSGVVKDAMDLNDGDTPILNAVEDTADALSFIPSLGSAMDGISAALSVGHSLANTANSLCVGKDPNANKPWANWQQKKPQQQQQWTQGNCPTMDCYAKCRAADIARHAQYKALNDAHLLKLQQLGCKGASCRTPSFAKTCAKKKSTSCGCTACKKPACKKSTTCKKKKVVYPRAKIQVCPGGICLR